MCRDCRAHRCGGWCEAHGLSIPSGVCGCWTWTRLPDAALLAKLVSTDAEPELAWRHGSVLAPRLARAGAGPGEPRRLDLTGTVLITGGVGELGREIARHLVERHGGASPVVDVAPRAEDARSG